MKNSLIAIAAGAALSALASPAFAVTVAPTINGTFSANISGTTSGDNPASLVTNGLGSPFTVSNLVVGGSAGDATSDPADPSGVGGLLFTVDPASCLKTGFPTGKETANVNITFSFYTAGGGLIGTASDTAIATFNYFANPNSSKDDDNLCWQNSAVSGNAVVAAGTSLVGTCGTPGTGLQTAYEQIEVNLGGSYYDVNLYDWNDWNETPSITFQSVPAPARVPEPASFALLAAGLFGLGFVVARRRRVETGAV